jgi:hypothetical protein
MVAIINKAKLYLVYSFFTLFGLWLVFALSLMSYALYLEFSDQQETLRNMTNWIEWRIDGTFKNSPENIWYEGPEDIAIGAITNKVQVGNLAGNRKLEFGVKNILEEVVQERGISLDPTSKNMLKVDIVYLDVLKTQSSLSIMHKNKESVVIRLQGFYYKDDKLYKKFLVEESADEISMSTLLVDEGGKFNNQNLSSALKKACSSLVTKIIEDKK